MSLVRLLILLTIFVSFPQLQAREECAPSRLFNGMMGRVIPSDPNNLRAEPSPDAERIGTISGGDIFMVVTEAQCLNGLLWIQVNYNGLIGWTVENAHWEYWIQPACQSVFTREQGGEVITRFESLSVLDTPTAEGQIVGALSFGEVFIVITTSQCVYEYEYPITWIEIATDTLQGWIRETEWGYCDAYCPSGRFLRRNVRLLLNPLPEAVGIPQKDPLLLPFNAITPQNVTNLALEGTLGDGRIIDFAWHPNSSHLAIATSLGLRVVNPRQLNQTSSLLTAHDDPLTTLMYHPDGTMLATGDARGTVILWETETYTPLYTLQHNSGIVDLIFSPDSTLAISQQMDFVTLWRVSATEIPEKRADLRVTWGGQLQLSPDGVTLVNVTESSLAVLDMATAEVRWSDVWESETIADWALMPDGKTVYVLTTLSTQPGVISFYMISHFSLEDYTWSERKDFEELTNQNGQSIPVSGFNIATSSIIDDWMINLGNMQIIYSGEMVAQLDVLNVTDAIFAPQTTLLALATIDGTIQLYNNARFVNILYGLSGQVVQQSFSPNGQYLAAQSEGATLAIWDIQNNQRLGTIPLNRVRGNFAINPDETQIIDQAQVWEIATGSNTPFSVPNLVSAFWLDGHWRLLNPLSKTVIDPLTGAVVSELAHPPADQYLTYSPDLRYGVAVVRGDDESYSYYRFDATSGQIVTALERYYDEVNTQIVSPSGQILLINANAQVQLWDLTRGVLLTQTSLEGNIIRAVFNSSEMVLGWVESSGENHQDLLMFVRWDLMTNQISRHPIEREGEVGVIAINLDGTLIAIANNATILIYETQSGELIHTLNAHVDVIYDLKFNTDGTRLYTASRDGTLRIWGLPN
ncbi:MAG: SH3 domain-containing protein [Anaerolineae bacterium]|nr:SH3 domain-containing protein [Anaerolineae bacterium]